MLSKRILVIITNFRHGGTNKSLENLLSFLDKQKFQIDVFGLVHSGPYLNTIDANILPKDNLLNLLFTNYRDAKGTFKYLVIFIKLISRLLGVLNIDFKTLLLKRAARRLSTKDRYQTILAFSEGMPTHLGSYIRNLNKIAWIRCDYSNYLEMNNHPNEKDIYVPYNSIICVSEYTKNIFNKVFPEFKQKTYAIYNILNTQSFLDKSNEYTLDLNFNFDGFKIISIGRFYRTKRFSIIPDIIKSLVELQCKFKWFIVGGEGDRYEFEEFNRKIKEYNLHDYIILLGEKNNPYPYIKNSDLLVSTSYTEACPNVINEAKVLHVPVVTADFGSAREFIDNGVNGYVVPIDKLAKTIAKLILNNNEYQNLKVSLLTYKYNNEDLLKKVNNLL